MDGLFGNPAMTYTTTEAARMLGVARRTVNLHAKRLDLPKHGPSYMIDDAGLERLRSSIVGVRGNPNWKKDDGS